MTIIKNNRNSEYIVRWFIMLNISLLLSFSLQEWSHEQGNGFLIQHKFAVRHPFNVVPYNKIFKYPAGSVSKESLLLQEMLTEASGVLSRAVSGPGGVSSRGVFFKQVTMVIPRSWDQRHCGVTLSEPGQGMAYQVRAEQSNVSNFQCLLSLINVGYA